jgi:hypothetical protein
MAAISARFCSGILVVTPGSRTSECGNGTNGNVALGAMMGYVVFVNDGVRIC